MCMPLWKSVFMCIDVNTETTERPGVCTVLPAKPGVYIRKYSLYYDTLILAESAIQNKQRLSQAAYIRQSEPGARKGSKRGVRAWCEEVEGVFLAQMSVSMLPSLTQKIDGFVNKDFVNCLLNG